MTRRSVRHFKPRVKLALLTLAVMMPLTWLSGACLNKAFHDFSLPNKMLVTVAELTAGAAVGALAILCAVEFAGLYGKWALEANRQDWIRCVNPDCDELLERPYASDPELGGKVCMDCEKDFIRRAARLAGDPV